MYHINGFILANSVDNKTEIVYNKAMQTVSSTDENGETTKYTYDSRYRVKTETGYYYLQSRYYDSNICRFINADIHEIVNVTKDVNVGINLFAYCNNNPINSRDINGHFYLLTVAGVSISAVSVAIIVAVFSFAILYAISPTFRSAVDDVVYMLANKAITAVKSFAATISAIVKVAKNSRKYNSNEVHHIVAKGDRRAKGSRNILNQCGISVNDRCNLVSIRKALHKHIHTNEYHKKIYSVLLGANKGKNKTVRKYRIQGTLMFIGFVLKVAGQLCK